ncbi:SDR family oxidoreductase [bacterium LRH843]|nr:SDR family oxidoreductase [bacterium LRH843]
MSLKNQVAIVTGATSGIGEGIASLFASHGAKVVVVGRNRDRGNTIVQKINETDGEAVFFQADVTDEEQVKSVVSKTIDTYGKIDILVNNAGIVFSGSIPETNLENWQNIYETNVTSVYLFCHHVLPYMIREKSGSIINIASEAGVKGLKNRAAYCAAKAAVIGLTKAMAVDHSPLGIRINAISPGTIETPMVEQVINSNPEPEEMRAELISRRILPYLGTVEEIAECARYLASSKARYMTGANIAIDGGATVK